MTNTAVEEIVRLASPVTYTRRTITEDVELGGVNMKAGEKACMFYLAANRDEELQHQRLAPPVRPRRNEAAAPLG